MLVIKLPPFPPTVISLRYGPIIRIVSYQLFKYLILMNWLTIMIRTKWVALC